MKRYIQLFLLFVVVFALGACIPVPVSVGTSTATVYEEPYDYGYDDQYGYEDDYVDVPIVYGEPSYYTPPIVVTFPYDYFTYEAVGPYVDIVFWRNGQRYRHEPWYDHGRRMSSNDIRTSRPYHRMRGKEFYEYREKLERNHHISHPDSYYKLEQYKQKRKLREQKDKLKQRDERYKQEQERREQQQKIREREERLKQEQREREQKNRLREQRERDKAGQERGEQRDK